MAIPFQDVLTSVNDQLDAKELLRRIGFRADGVTVVGNKLKTYCPAHRGETFKSLQVDPQARICVCIQKDCPASAPCTLVELYAHAKKIDKLAAALELARELRIPVEQRTVQSIADYFVGRADDAMRTGNPGDTQQYLAVAQATDPENGELAVRLAASMERSGAEPGMLAEEYLRAARLLRRRQPDRAIATLRDDVLRLAPGHPGHLQELARWLRETRPEDGEWAEVTAARARALAAAGDRNAALSDFRDAAAALREDLPLRCEYAECLLASGNAPAAAAEMLAVADVLLARGDGKGAVARAEAARAADPAAESPLRRLGEIKLSLGDLDGFVAANLELAQRAMSAADAAGATRYLRLVTDADPKNFAALEMLARLAGERGDAAGAATARMDLAEAALAAGKPTDADRILIALEPELPPAAALCDRFGRLLAHRGRVNVAADQFLRAAELHLAAGGIDEANASLDAMVAALPLDESRHLAAVRMLALAGLRDEAAVRSRALVSALRHHEAIRQAVEALDEVKRLLPDDPELELLQIELLFDAPDGDRLVPAVLNAHGWLAAARRGAEDEANLRRALAIFPEDHRLIEALAGHLLSEGRNDEALAMLERITALAGAPADLRLRALEQVCDFRPADGALWASLGDARESAGNAPGAVAAWQRAAAIHAESGRPEDALPLVLKAAALEPGSLPLMELAADIALRSGDRATATESYAAYLECVVDSEPPETAELAFQRVMARQPDEPAHLGRFAAWLAAQQRDAEARDARHRLAMLHAERGDPAPAIAVLEDLLAEEPGRETSRRLLVDMLRAADRPRDAAVQLLVIAGQQATDGDIEGAVAAFAAARALRPPAAEELLLLADWQEKLGASTDAVATLMEVDSLRTDPLLPAEECDFCARILSLDDGDIAMHARYARALEAAGRAEEAAAKHHFLAEEAAGSGDPAGALSHARKASELDPENRQYRLALLEQLGGGGDTAALDAEATSFAEALVAEGDLAGARAALARIERLHAEDPAFLARLGMIERQLGKAEEAAAHFVDAAALHEAAGNIAGAVDLLRDILAIDPMRHAVREHLATVLRRGGRTSEAVAEYYALLDGLLAQGHDSLAESVVGDIEALLGVDWPKRSELLGQLEVLQQEAMALRSAHRFLHSAQEENALPAAIAACEYLLLREPESADLLRTLAELQIDAGDLRHAAESYLKVVALAPEADRLAALREARAAVPSDAAIHRVLFRELLVRGEAAEAAAEWPALRESLLAAGGREEAVALARELLGAAPLELPVRRGLIEDLRALGRAPQAIMELRDIVGVWRSIDPKIARAALEEVLDLQPDSEDDLNLLIGLVKDTEGEDAARPLQTRALDMLRARYPDAADFAAHARRMVEADPKNAILRRRFAELLREAGDHAGAVAELFSLASETADKLKPLPALELWDKLADWAPDRADIHRAVAAAAERAKKRDRAADALAKADALLEAAGDVRALRDVLEARLKHAPGDAELSERLAAAQLATGAPDAAARTLRELAEAYRSAKDHPRREAALARLCELEPANLDLLREHAEAQEDAGRRAEAFAEWLRLAREFMGSARTAEAADAALHAKAIDPDDPAPRQMLLSAHLALGEWEDLCQEIEELARLYFVVEDNARAVALLRDEAERFVESTQFVLAGRLLSAFPEALSAEPRLRRLRALAFEGEARTIEAAADWHELARAHAAAGEGPQAEFSLRRSLRLNPADIGARTDLAEILRGEPARKAELVAELRELAARLERNKRIEDVARLLAEIHENDPADWTSVRRAAELELEAGKHAEARAHFLAYGAAMAAAGSHGEAESAFLRAVELDRNCGAAHAGLLAVYEATGVAAKAAEWGLRYADLLEENFAAEDARRILERVAEADRSSDIVRERLAAICEKAGDIAGAVRRLRELYAIQMKAGRTARALDLLSRIEKLEPDGADFSEERGRILLASGETAQGAYHLRLAAEREFSLGRSDKAMALTAELLALLPEDEALHGLRAEILREGGDIAGAVAELRIRSGILAAAGERDRQLEVLQQALALDPRHGDVREETAELLLSLGRNAESAQQYLTLSRVREEAGDLAAAIVAAEAALSMEPDEREPHLRLAVLLEASGQARHAASERAWLAEWHERNMEFQSALEHLQAAARLDRSDAIRLRVARMQAKTGRAEESAKEFAAVAAAARAAGDSALELEALAGAFEMQPTNRDVLKELAGLFRAQHKPERAEDLYVQSIGAHLAVGDIETARALIREAEKSSPAALAFKRRAAQEFLRHDVPELAAVMMYEVATDLAASGSTDEALAEVEQALLLKHTDVSAQELRLDLLTRLGRSDEAFELAEALVALLLERDDSARAAEICRRAIRLRPDAPEPRIRLAAILGLRRDTNQQIQELRELADLYLRTNDLDSAMKVLKDLLAIRPDDTRARVFYIDAYRQIGPESDLVDDYLKLADIHGRHGAVLESAKVFERLIELAPKRTDVQEKFIAFLLGNGQASRAAAQTYGLVATLLERKEAKKAAEVLERVRPHAVEDPEFYVTIGQVNLALNQRGMAVRELRRGAELFRRKGQPQRESEILRQLLDIDPLNLETRQELIAALLGAARTPEALAAMEELARTYIERGLPDLAEAELRRILSMDPERPDTWQLLFDTHAQIGAESDLVPDYLEFAEMMARKGDIRRSLDGYRKACELDTRNVRARRGYVTQYPKIGKISDITDEILHLAQLLIEEGEADEAARFFELVMSVDPSNTVARDMLSATKSGADSQSSPIPTSSSAGVRKLVMKSPGMEEFDISATQMKALRPSSPAQASTFLKGTLDDIERRESEEALQQVVNNYRDILAVNSGSANVRVKLADVLEQMGRTTEMLQELYIACESFFQRDDLNACVAVCERYLKYNPNDNRVRKRLNEAIVKRDAFKALESAIILSDKEE